MVLDPRVTLVCLVIFPGVASETVNGKLEIVSSLLEIIDVVVLCICLSLSHFITELFLNLQSIKFGGILYK